MVLVPTVDSQQSYSLENAPPSPWPSSKSGRPLPHAPLVLREIDVCRETRQHSSKSQYPTLHVPRSVLAYHRTTQAKTTTETDTSKNKAPPPEDLIGKLPGEIRNAIYKVLAPSCAVAADQPDAICVRYGTWRPSSTRPNKYVRWEEPSLLAAVNWIRLEARQVYFQSPIEIAVTTSEIKPACEWLRTVAQSDDDGKCLGRVTFWLSSGSWEDMQSWLPLAQLLREYRFGRPRKRYEEQEGPRASEHVPEVKVVYERHHRIAAALNEVIALGIEAREQDWSNTELEFAYWNWMDGKSNRLLSRKSRQRRSALA